MGLSEFLKVEENGDDFLTSLERDRDRDFERLETRRKQARLKSAHAFSVQDHPYEISIVAPSG
jgi:hypothetical protein